MEDGRRRWVEGKKEQELKQSEADIEAWQRKEAAAAMMLKAEAEGSSALTTTFKATSGQAAKDAVCRFPRKSKHGSAIFDDSRLPPPRRANTANRIPCGSK